MGAADSEPISEWEFKMLHGGFGSQERLRGALTAEARAGWDLYEKLDNQRLRLRRPISARAGDSSLDFDPYRSHHGMFSNPQAVVVIAAILGVVTFVGVLLGIVLTG